MYFTKMSATDTLNPYSWKLPPSDAINPSYHIAFDDTHYQYLYNHPVDVTKIGDQPGRDIVIGDRPGRDIVIGDDPKYQFNFDDYRQLIQTKPDDTEQQFAPFSEKRGEEIARRLTSYAAMLYRIDRRTYHSDLESFTGADVIAVAVNVEHYLKNRLNFSNHQALIGYCTALLAMTELHNCNNHSQIDLIVDNQSYFKPTIQYFAKYYNDWHNHKNVITDDVVGSVIIAMYYKWKSDIGHRDADLKNQKRFNKWYKNVSKSIDRANKILDAINQKFSLILK